MKGRGKDFFCKWPLACVVSIGAGYVAGGLFFPHIVLAGDLDLEGAIYSYAHPGSAKPPAHPAPKKVPKSAPPKKKPHKPAEVKKTAPPVSDKKEVPKNVSLPPAPHPEEVFQPYFAALRGNKVYMRRGPGVNYPIDWVYYRRGLPVKVSREFQNWCQVEDNFGDKGWMHKATLRSLRNFVVVPPATAKEEIHLSKEVAGKQIAPKQYDPHIISYCASADKRCAFQTFPIYSAPDSRERPLALLLPGVVGRVVKCGDKWKNWCEVSVAGYKGWIEKSRLWGALDDDATSKDRKKF